MAAGQPPDEVEQKENKGEEVLISGAEQIKGGNAIPVIKDGTPSTKSAEVQVDIEDKAEKIIAGGIKHTDESERGKELTAEDSTWSDDRHGISLTDSWSANDKGKMNENERREFIQEEET
ncbi:hypothetical protein HAX54_005568 [Datura stramonium]|uniref:Uncharacterized protein n=1 Tax=Datura stramonium TaxID=4076 RepID=A0ABS8RWI1_DATST|nr:hypothetical protein [Datura stramonium]